MHRFVPQFQGSPWPSGARVLHVYALPDPPFANELLRLANACRKAMTGYPIAPLSDELLHITIEMVCDALATEISKEGQSEITAALTRHCADIDPVVALCGSPISGQSGVLLDMWPDDGLVTVRKAVSAALREVRGKAAVRRSGGRPHLSLGYAGGSADSDPLQSALRKITPGHAPIAITRLHLVNVLFTERPAGWEIAWESIAVIPLGRMGRTDSPVESHASTTPPDMAELSRRS
ncbi:hypothetical protein Acor_81560 [Acrocarpospora corrugata]|uniref:2'-5' RNA ligase n=1 Tax=Acrocarpospora corrugata TaxID=35763 RepID=A0A5M3WAM1_9ACTN|nr:hypothetical protein [Acrocarpospora corrugata]GES06087.1 hypothetical protein Acor_81560 [Acrocarpospora corrugata]